MHAWVNYPVCRSHTANRDGPEATCRAGIGHQCAAGQGRGAHQLGHGRDHGLDILALVLGLSLDGPVKPGAVAGL
jgi:hypothetical protein